MKDVAVAITATGCSEQWGRGHCRLEPDPQDQILPETIQAGTPRTLSVLLHCRMSQQDTEYIASAKQASRVSKEQTAHLLTAN